MDGSEIPIPTFAMDAADSKNLMFREVHQSPGDE
jgi:hypothetical protein